MRSEQADGAGELRVQDVSVFVSDYQVEIQVPVRKNKQLAAAERRRDEILF